MVEAQVYRLTHAARAAAGSRVSAHLEPTIKAVILGNAGAGKSTVARALAARESAALLSLDDVAFEGGAQRRPLQASVAAVRHFIASHERWVMEGCYADILAPVIERCEEFVFLNPGVDTCVAHCRARPWEPDKYESAEAQHRNLELLIEWVCTYETRDDEYGLRSHRALYDAFRGRKQEYTDPRLYPRG